MKAVSWIMLFAACCTVVCGQPAQHAQTITTLDKKLKSGALNISQVLTNRQWMPLHSLTPFREMIRQHARAEKITLTAPDEPGFPMTVRGTVVDGAGRPMPDVLIYVYQTSDQGWYADTAAHIREGDFRHARLFGYLKTDGEGKFEFETIRPVGYPSSDLPAHIHIAFWSPDGQPVRSMPEELLFEEDDRLTPERRKQALESGYLVAKNSGTDSRGVYAYRLAPGR